MDGSPSYHGDRAEPPTAAALVLGRASFTLIARPTPVVPFKPAMAGRPHENRVFHESETARRPGPGSVIKNDAVHCSERFECSTDRFLGAPKSRCLHISSSWFLLTLIGGLTRQGKCDLASVRTIFKTHHLGYAQVDFVRFTLRLPGPRAATRYKLLAKPSKYR